MGAIFVCILIAVVISAIIMTIVRSKLKSVRSEHAACNYVRSEGLKLTNQSDAFLYSNVTSRPRQSNNNQKKNSNPRSPRPGRR